MRQGLPVKLNMRLWAALSVMLILANSASVAMNLSGSTGRTILADMQNSSNKTVIPNNSSNFWSWGTIPEGHAVKNGSLIEKPLNIILNSGEDSGTMETPAQAMGLSDSIVNGAVR